MGTVAWKTVGDKLSMTRKTATGSAVSGACKVYWMTIAVDDDHGKLDLSDGTSSGTTIWTWEDYVGVAGGTQNFDPPMPFATGIYIETFYHLGAVTFGYLLDSAQ